MSLFAGKQTYDRPTPSPRYLYFWLSGQQIVKSYFIEIHSKVILNFFSHIQYILFLTYNTTNNDPNPLKSRRKTHLTLKNTLNMYVNY